MCLLVLMTLWSHNAQAVWGFEAQGVYFSDSQKSAAETQSTKFLWQSSFLVDVTKQLYIGWSYGALSLDQEFGTSKNRLETQDMGLAVRYFFGKRSTSYSAYLIYNILAKGQQSNGTTEEDLSGTSYLLGFSFVPQISETFRMGVQVNYYNADYTKKTVNGTETSTNYSKNWIFPSVVLIKTF